MTAAMTSRGIYEFVFGGLLAERDELLRFWEVLGFTVAAEGELPAGAAAAAYGHPARCLGLRLRHKGCDSFGTGQVRLQLWEQLRNDGLGKSDPIVTGSRWMGMYTQDILQLRDSFESEQASNDWDLWISPLVSAALMNPAPEPDFYSPFVGLRETLVFGKRFRLAFIQRGGFERPGFGTFDASLPFKNTEGSHANIVQPDNSFSTDFYKRAFDFETAPFGEAHDSGDEAPTIAALKLRPGETFHVERTRAKDCPSGLLQVYSSYMPSDDLREQSRPGSGNLCAYSVRVSDLTRLIDVIDGDPDATHRDEFADEFGERAVCFDAPDGYTWIAVNDVG